MDGCKSGELHHAVYYLNEDGLLIRRGQSVALLKFGYVGARSPVRAPGPSHGSVWLRSFLGNETTIFGNLPQARAPGCGKIGAYRRDR